MKENYLLIAWNEIDEKDKTYSIKPCNSLEQAKHEMKKYVRWGSDKYIAAMIYKDKNGKLHELK